MANKAKPGQMTIPAELVLNVDTVEAIAASVKEDQPPAHKVVRVAIGMLESLASGAILMSPVLVRRVAEAVGKEIDATDIADLAEIGAGRRAGQLSVTLNIDPVYEDLLRTNADFQGMTIGQLLQNSMDTAWDNGWFYTMPAGTATHVQMRDADKRSLEAILGKPFNSGTELIALIKDLVGGDLFDGPAPEAANVQQPQVITRSRTQEEWEALSAEDKKKALEAAA